MERLEIGKEKKAVPAFKKPGSFDKVADALRRSGDKKHLETVEAKTGAV